MNQDSDGAWLTMFLFCGHFGVDVVQGFTFQFRFQISNTNIFCLVDVSFGCGAGQGSVQNQTTPAAAVTMTSGRTSKYPSKQRFETTMREEARKDTEATTKFDHVPASLNDSCANGVVLVHSEEYTSVLCKAMGYIQGDRDILLGALLDYCGFLQGAPKFLRVLPPVLSSRQELESFHSGAYLDMLQGKTLHNGNDTEDDTDTTNDKESDMKRDCIVDDVDTLERFGLTDDCRLPTSIESRAVLWRYCRFVVGASLLGSRMLAKNQANVAVNWGGGRHHANRARADGFCFVNDVVIAIKQLRQRFRRVLYVDMDIHHGDGVQNAFYDTDKVLTVSLHRHSPGFFPATSGSPKEKGRNGTPGLGYNLNVPVPAGCNDTDFLGLFDQIFESVLPLFDPRAVVLCVGCDGLRGDPLVGQTDSWRLSPYGIASCVRRASAVCQRSGLKLLVVGGGGYDPAETAKTLLLATAAACEGSRPGMLEELPTDVPRHRYFHRYGPDFRLMPVETEIRPANPLSDDSANGDGLSVKRSRRIQKDEKSSEKSLESSEEFSTDRNDVPVPVLQEGGGTDTVQEALKDARDGIRCCALFLRSKRTEMNRAFQYAYDYDKEIINP